MSVLSVVDTLPNDLVVVGENAARAWMRGTKKLRDYIEPMALGIFEARKRWTANQDFGAWLEGSPFAAMGKTDRAALIKLGELWSDELATRIKDIPSSSPRMILKACSPSGNTDDDDESGSTFYGGDRINRSNEAWDTIDPRLVQSLVEAVPYLKNHKVWEPAAGCGRMVDQLQAAGVEVIATTDIEPRRDDIASQDLFDCEAMPTGTDCIITNPPWGNLASPFVRHCLKLAENAKALVAMLVPLPWVAGRKIADMTGSPGLETLVVPRYRARWMTPEEEAELAAQMEADGKEWSPAPKMNHVWIVWDFGRDTAVAPVIQFIDEPAS